MGRIRTIKPEFFTNEGLSALNADTHLFAGGLLCYADDEGYFNAHPGLVKAAIFPLRESSVSVHGMLTQLSIAAFLRLGKTADSKSWGQVIKFSEHQRVNRPTPSKIKGLEIVWEPSVITHTQFTEDSLPEGKGRELGKEQGRELGTGKGNGRGEPQKRSRKSAPEIDLPDWVPKVPWDAFVEMRKDTKHPMTAKAMHLAIIDLDQLRETGSDPAAVLNQSTMKSWRGLFEVRNGNNGHAKPIGEGERLLADFRQQQAQKRASKNGGSAVVRDARQAREPAGDELLAGTVLPDTW